MERLTDFLDDLKIRLRNPLVSSFVISWFLWNWNIWLGLIFLDKSSLIEAGYVNHLNFIQDNLSIKMGLFYPFLSAVTLTIVLPILRNLVEYYSALSMNWGDKICLKASKDGVISIDKYLEKKESINKLKMEITEIIQDEINLKQSLQNEKYENTKLTNRIAEIEEEVRNLDRTINNAINEKSMRGRWQISPPLFERYDRVEVVDE
jgi:hypothetical protein